jgi:hypothetical protein
MNGSEKNSPKLYSVSTPGVLFDFLINSLYIIVSYSSNCGTCSTDVVVSPGVQVVFDQTGTVGLCTQRGCGKELDLARMSESSDSKRDWLVSARS